MDESKCPAHKRDLIFNLIERRCSQLNSANQCRMMPPNKCVFLNVKKKKDKPTMKHLEFQIGSTPMNSRLLLDNEVIEGVTRVSIECDANKKLNKMFIETEVDPDFGTTIPEQTFIAEVTISHNIIDRK